MRTLLFPLLLDLSRCYRILVCYSIFNRLLLGSTATPGFIPPVSFTQPFVCHLGGVVVSVLATGPKGRGFKLGRRIFKGDKYRQHTFRRMGSKAGGPM
jgi:hypothetical protein